MREPFPRRVTGASVRSQRGHMLGATVFASVLGAILAGGYLWLDGRREAESHAQDGSANARGAADQWTRRLGKFLTKGPEGGTWETRFLSCVYTNFLAPHPTKSDLLLIADVTAEGTAAGHARAVSRWLVPRHFFRAPASVFFSNYVRARAPEVEVLADGTRTQRVHWRPRADFDGLVDTERRVWFAESDGEVVQVEDRSRTGNLIRSLRRVSKTTAGWDPARLDPGRVDHRELEPPDPHSDPDRALATVVERAPFPVFVPSYLPPGFVLVRPSYTVYDPESADSESPTRVQLVSQLYSDGLALISVGIAPRGDMDLIERLSMGGSADPNDPASCPGLPSEPRDIRQEDGSRIRMRTDTCRTVLRRDDLVGVSVTLIGRNELPTDEYLRMMGSLQPAEAPRVSGTER